MIARIWNALRKNNKTKQINCNRHTSRHVVYVFKDTLKLLLLHSELVLCHFKDNYSDFMKTNLHILSENVKYYE